MNRNLFFSVFIFVSLITLSSFSALTGLDILSPYPDTPIYQFGADFAEINLGNVLRNPAHGGPGVWKVFETDGTGGSFISLNHSISPA